MKPKPGDLVRVDPSIPVFGGWEGVVLWVVDGPFGFPYAVLIKGAVIRFPDHYLTVVQPSWSSIEKLP